MKLIVVLVLLPILAVAQTVSNCTPVLDRRYLKPEIESAMCIPDGYRIMNLWKISITGENRDKVISWQKTKRKDGDTLHFTVYKRNEHGSLIKYKRLDNLSPLRFLNSGEGGTRNKFYDSLKNLYSHPELSEVKFGGDTLTISYFTEAATKLELRFLFSQQKDTWILEREIEWFEVPDLSQPKHKEADRKPKVAIRVEDFHMPTYWENHN